MKKLSIEEKAIAYDEALEKAKEIIKDYESRNLNDIAIYAKEDLTVIFPELAESEDEKIREGIIRCVKGNMPDNDSRKKYLAWLENQGEQKAGRWSEEDKEITRSLLDIIYECHSHGKCTLKLNEYLKLCNWLRFLKERCCPQKLSNVERNGKNWKPSESDINLLERIFSGKSDPKDFQATLCCIIEQLKAL